MRRLAIPVLAAVTLLSGAAQADETFDSFRNFCAAGRAAPASALALADAAGWSPVPPQFLSQMPQFQGADGRVHQSANGTLVLITARGAQPVLGPVRICAIGVVPASASNVAGQLQAFAGVPKQAAPDLPEGLYAWRDENGRHVSVDRNGPDFRNQVASGAALVASTTTTPQMALILLMAAQ